MQRSACQWQALLQHYNKTAYEMFNKAVSKQLPVSFEVYPSDYSSKWYHMNAYPSADGLTVYFLDITKRKQVEEELRQSEERLNAAFHMSPAMMAILGMGDNRFVEANQSYLDTLEFSREELIGHTPGELGLVIDKNASSNMEMLKAQKALNERETILSCLIDRNEIRQLILNMCRNAMEAMSSYGTLTIGTRPEGDEVVLYIRDEGSGLPPQIIDKLGTPFVTTKDNGTGLGLAICYSIAARHKARIDYDTGPTGTTFYVRFPIGNDLAAHQVEKNRGGSLTIPSPRPKARFTLL